MRLILDYIKAAIRFNRALRYSEKADALPWTDDDRQSYATFMNSGVGRKLRARMFNNIIKFSQDAVRNQSLWENGRAAGIAEHATFLDSHLPPVESASQQFESEEELDGLPLDSPEYAV